jgi:hypothetical protein
MGITVVYERGTAANAEAARETADQGDGNHCHSAEDRPHECKLEDELLVGTISGFCDEHELRRPIRRGPNRDCDQNACSSRESLRGTPVGMGSALLMRNASDDRFESEAIGESHRTGLAKPLKDVCELKDPVLDQRTHTIPVLNLTGGW